MVKRLLTAVVGVPLIIAIVIFSTYLPVLINAAAAIICIMCAGEFSTAVKTSISLKCWWTIPIPKA